MASSKRKLRGKKRWTFEIGPCYSLPHIPDDAHDWLIGLWTSGMPPLVGGRGARVTVEIQTSPKPRKGGQ